MKNLVAPLFQMINWRFRLSKPYIFCAYFMADPIRSMQCCVPWRCCSVIYNRHLVPGWSWKCSTRVKFNCLCFNFPLKPSERSEEQVHLREFSYMFFLQFYWSYESLWDTNMGTGVFNFVSELYFPTSTNRIMSKSWNNKRLLCKCFYLDLLWFFIQ